MSNYQTVVSAMPTRVPDDPSLPEPRVIISWHVKLCHVQSEVRGGTEFPPRVLDRRAFSYELSTRACRFAKPRDHLLSSPSWAIVSSMLDHMRLPFLLDRLRWLDLSPETNATQKCLTGDELASEIARVVSSEVKNPRNKGRKRTKVEVRMRHEVMISEREFRELRVQLRRLELQYLHSRLLQEEERGRRFPILERRFLLNLMRQEGLVANPDHTRESLDQAAINLVAPRESIIQSLDKVAIC